MGYYIIRVAVSAAIIVGVSELARAFPRMGALILSLPIVSMLAFIFTWHKDKNISVISNLSKETLILVPLGLAFFMPLALAERLQIGFWFAFLLGVIAASICIGAYLIFFSP